MAEILLELTVFGAPIALKRHRRRKDKNKFGTEITIDYDPSSEDKKTFLWKAIAAKKPPKPFNEALMVKMIFYMPRPKSHYGTGKNAGKLKDSAPIFHTKKPDVDNISKFVFDALNKIYWTDDSIISTEIARKIYSENPRVKITIKRDCLT